MKTVYKFHGTGNDFILLDFFSEVCLISASEIIALCNRHTGVGADGLILINKSETSDFRMIYYNSDGLEADMCGNGARCAIAFAYSQKHCGKTTTFSARDGIHHGEILQDQGVEWLVKITLRLNDLPIQLEDNSYFVNTGVPHNVRIVENINDINVKTEGARFRNNKQLFTNGANINFITLRQNSVYIRTYERGVENETLSCGTGVTASALVAHHFFGYPFPVTVHALGGNLSVSEENGFLWLEGSARHVFTTIIH